MFPRDYSERRGENRRFRSSPDHGVCRPFFLLFLIGGVFAIFFPFKTLVHVHRYLLVLCLLSFKLGECDRVFAGYVLDETNIRKRPETRFGRERET